MRTQVGIVGAGPAGLLLARLLQQRGIDSVVLESRPRARIEARIRAGVLEQGTADTLREAGAGARMEAQGLVHHGFELRFADRVHRIDLSGLAGGRSVTVYGQHEVVRDLVAQRLDTGAPLLFEAADVAIHDTDGAPRITFRHEGRDRALACDWIAGCDGFHGACRASVPPEAITLYEKVYPFAWLGVLADVAPSHEELIYAHHERGFALHSMRSPEVTRLYLQCAPDEDLAAWPDARIWAELRRRLPGMDLADGPVTARGVTAMRSFVAEPMRFGRLFLAGDAAHIVPPTGAKGMNLAVADVRVLAAALGAHYAGRGDGLLDAYSATCLRRIWKVQRFSWWMTSLLHRFPGDDAFDRRRQLAELDYVAGSEAASATVAENYVGLPLD